MLIEKLSNPDFSYCEKQVVEFILKYPNVVVKLSLEELAKEVAVSQASIIRLCKKLGSKGYAEFKVQLAQELNTFAQDNQVISPEIPISEGMDVSAIEETFQRLTKQSVDFTKESIEQRELIRVANLLNNADIIHLYGRGESLILALDFHYKMMRIGKHTHVEAINGFYENQNNAKNPKLHECALIISQYMNSQQVHYMIDEYLQAGIPIVILTAQDNIWPYDKYAYSVLRINIKEKRTKMGCFASRTAFLYILDCLYGLIFSKNYNKNREHLIQSAERKKTHDYYYSLLKEN